MVRMHGTPHERPFKVDIKVPGALKYRTEYVNANSVLEAIHKGKQLEQANPGSKVMRVNLANFFQ